MARKKTSGNKSNTKKKNTKKNQNTTPQDQYKHSAFTAAQDLQYKKYVNRMYKEGKQPLPKRKWYKEIYKKKG